MKPANCTVISLLLLLLFGCSDKISKIESKNAHHSNTELFDSSMHFFVKKYSSGAIINFNDTSSYSTQFRLRKRIYLPGFQDLTFEIRSLSRTSADDASIIFIYNDSVSFLLPFFEPEYYKALFSTGRDTLGLKQYEGFGEKFGELVNVLKLEQAHEVIQLSDIVMELLHAKKMMSNGEYSAVMRDLKKKIRLTLPPCNKSLNRTLKALHELDREGAIAYTDGSVIYHLLKTKEGNWDFEILNPECFTKFSF